MTKLILAMATVGLFSGVARADHGGVKHVCKSGKVERTVTVVYEQEGKKAPCSVKYLRDAGDEKELYKAQAEEGYCEARADEFVKKLAGNGWECSSAN